MPKERAAKIKQLPGKPAGSDSRIGSDHDYLLEGGVFTKETIDVWIDYKKAIRRSTRYGCGRTRTSSISTMTCEGISWER